MLVRSGSVSKRIIPWMHMMDKLGDNGRWFDNDVIDAYSEKDVKEEPIDHTSNHRTGVLVPIFNWVDTRMMNGIKSDCSNRGCVVKAYRRLGKRHSWMAPGKWKGAGKHQNDVTRALKFFKENEKEILKEILRKKLKIWVGR